MSKVAKMNHKSGPIGTFFRRVGTVLVFPFAFLWFFLIYWQPGLKRIWNPDPIKVYIIGRDSSFDHHGRAKVIPNVRFQKERTIKGGSGTYLHVTQGLMQNPSFEYAFRVDRPDKLKNPSTAVLRQIKKKFEEMGYEVRILTLCVDGHEIVHVL